ncbi:MAG: SPOR domain-containing protein [Methylococcales bacterium]|nr:SPOR domain-containing protein [Methylococcales bacterium]
MARDYKDRANQRKKPAKQIQATVAWWKWGLVICLIALFIGFLVFLQSSAPEEESAQQTKTISTSKKTANKAKTTPKQKNKKPEEPRFDFYTILPETEIVVPDYEIDTRSREEQFGKAKKSNKYLMQAGSFRQFSEADKLRARLALMGIESRVEKAKVGNVIWNRVKLGPYSNSSSVSVIKKRLKQNGIDIIVTEIKG